MRRYRTLKVFLILREICFIRHCILVWLLWFSSSLLAWWPRCFTSDEGNVRARKASVLKMINLNKVGGEFDQ